MHTTENWLVAQVAPGMLTALTAWFRFSDNTALRTGNARRLRTSANTCSGAPIATSSESTATVTEASMPERMLTATSRELLETSGSLLAVTRARAVMLAATEELRRHAHGPLFARGVPCQSCR